MKIFEFDSPEDMKDGAVAKQVDEDLSEFCKIIKSSSEICEA